MNNAIALIGGGAGALAFIYRYLRVSDEVSQLPRTLYVFEKRQAVGPGAAYEFDVATNLLNTKTAYITPFPDRPGDFYAWLHANPSLWQSEFPSFNAGPDTYAPRPLFGLYLKDRMGWIVGLAASRGVHIVQIPQEVKSIRRLGQSAYALHTTKDLVVAVQQVVLACGTLPERHGAAVHSDRSFANPYPIARLRQRIPQDARVAIVGARLSAIDTVIGLMDSGHRGPISIYSRSGYFPSVRGTQGRIVPRYLTAEGIEALQATKGRLNLRDIATLVRMEIAHQSGEDLSDIPALQEPPPPPIDLQAFLKEELELAQRPRAWQAVLYSTNSIIERLWSSLQDDEKTLMLEKYMAAFMAYRVSIPAENGKKILTYLESGQMNFYAGPCLASLDVTGMPTVTSGNICRTYDYVVNAKGSPRSVQELDSPLIQDLLAKGLVTPDEWGGVRIDPCSYKPLSSAGTPVDGIRVMGELTTGSFFFTSALDINARHAGLCIDSIAQEAIDLQPLPAQMPEQATHRIGVASV